MFTDPFDMFFPFRWKSSLVVSQYLFTLVEYLVAFGKISDLLEPFGTLLALSLCLSVQFRRFEVGQVLEKFNFRVRDLKLFRSS